MVAPRKHFPTLLEQRILAALAENSPKSIEHLAEFLTPANAPAIVDALIDLYAAKKIQMTLEGQCSLRVDSGSEDP